MMRTVYGKQRCFVSILMLCLIIVIMYVTSFDAFPAAGGICQVGDVIAPGESCTYPDTNTKFSVNASGTGQFLFLSVGSNLNLEDATINGVTYTLVAKKLASGSWEIEKIGTSSGTTNTAPVFTDGSSTTRSIAENTAANTNIGTAIAATDADNDTLTYTLGGTDAASFGIVSTSGQLQTKVALDYETKTSYSVTITVSDGNGGSDSITVTINVTDVNEAVIISPRFVPVTDRTSEVRDAIVAAIPNVTDAAKVTKAQVAAITSLNLRNAGITALAAGDFSGMTGLTSLNLYNNQLSSLPNRIFEGLTSLTTVRLGSNVIDPLPLTVSLEKVEVGQFKAVVPTGALSDIVLHITVTNGSVTGGATTLTIPHGSVENGPLAVTRTAGTTAHVTVDIEAFPSLPRNHYGYTLVKPDNLPLIISRGTNTAPVFTDGSSTTRSIAENTAANTNIGTAIAATDADNDTLTYSLGNLGGPIGLSGSDAASFRIVSTSGQLQTKAALDYETKSSYTVTVSVSDGNGGTDSITVTINVTDVNETPANTAPVFTDGTSTTRTVAENTAANTNIGTAIAATDADNDTLTYTLGGTDAASFGIVSTSGQLQTKAALDYETKTSYSVTVSVSDGNGGTDSITVTINVTDVTEPSTPPQQPTTLVESDYDHIQGPWLWMIAPGGNLNTDNLSKASDGVITEAQIAHNGVNEGEHFNQLQWTKGRILPTTVCGIFLCSSDNVINVVRQIGLTDRSQLTYYSAYALINISSHRAQNNVLMGVGSDDSIKVWLNGSVVYKNDVTRRTTGIQNRFRVNLNAGNNLLLIKVCNSGSWIGNDDWGMFFKIYLDPADYTISLPMRDLENTAPVFTDGSRTTRSIAENTNSGLGIGPAVSATDANNDTLTYTLGGTDAASFGIVSTSGQLQTKAALDYETKTTYTVTVTVSDGKLIDTITVTINVTDINETIPNRAPVFTEGSTATRSVAENTGANINIGPAVAATDADGNTLAYTLGGTDAASFGIVSTTGQLQTKAALDYETKTTYTVSVTVSDGTLTDTITVTINITDINETIPNRAPVFTEGSTATRSVAENTGANMNIGTAVAATDADGNTLVYTLGGTDAASFGIVSTSGQLQTKAALDYETKTTYTVTVTVSDGTLTDTITVTINITDVNEAQQQQTTAVCKVGDLLDPGESCTYPNTDAVFSVQNDGKSKWNIPNLPPLLQWINQVSIGGSMRVSTTINGVNYHLVAEQTGNTWEIKEIGDQGGQQPGTPPQQPPNTGATPTLNVTAASQLTESTLHGGIITLNLTDGTFESSSFRIRNAVSISGVAGVTVDTFGVDRVSDTQATVELEFDGNMTANGTLTVSVGAGALKDYNGTALTSQISVTAVTESITASTASALTEATLDEAEVTLTLSGRKFERSVFDIRDEVSVSGITGVTFPWHDPDRDSDTEITLELEFDGDMTTNGILTFTVGADAIAGYNGPDLTAQINVTATGGTVTPTPTNSAPVFTDGTSTTRSVAENTTSGTNIGTAVSATDANGDTLTYSLSGVDAASFSIVSTSGQLQTNAALDYETKTSYSVTVSVSDGNGGSDSITVTINVTDVNENVANNAPVFTDGASTTRSVAENTASGTNIGSAVSATDADNHTLTYSLSGTDAASFSIVSTSGQLQTNAALDYETKTSYSVTVSVSDGNGGSDSITVTINVTDVNETSTTSSLSVSTSTLTEATIDGTEVTLTLSGYEFERSIFDIRGATSISGITGVTFPWHDPDRESNTEITLELEFEGNMTTNGTLTFTIGAGAIKNYTGSALTATISVSAVTESLTVSPTSLTEATLDEAEVTLTLSGRKFERSVFDIRDEVSVSGITGVTFPWHDPDRDSDTEITLELEFDGDLTSGGTLTFTIGADAIAGYNGPDLTAQLTVTASGGVGLGANFPNPFNPETWIPYQLAKPADVTLTIYNLRGVMVRQLQLGHKTAGVYSSRSRAIHWDGKNEFGESVASGVYFYTLTAGDFTATRKMLIRK